MKFYRYFKYLLRYTYYQIYYLLIFKKFHSCLIGIGKDVRFRFHKNSSLSLGSKVFFDDFCSLELDSDSIVNIEDGVQFNRFCAVSARSTIRIGKNTIFGPNCKIYDHNHIFDCTSPVKKTEFSKGFVDIGEGCWFSANVVICRDVKIGDFCVVGANMVVRSDLPKGTVFK